MTNPLLLALERIEMSIFVIRGSYPVTMAESLRQRLNERFEILGLIEGANAEL